MLVHCPYVVLHSMALITKTQVLQVRVESDLLDGFTQAAEARHMTVSACIRDLMRQHAKSYQDHLKRLEYAERKRADRALAESQATSVPTVPKKGAVAPVDEPEGYILPRQSRSERRKSERDAAKGR